MLKHRLLEARTLRACVGTFTRRKTVSSKSQCCFTYCHATDTLQVEYCVVSKCSVVSKNSHTCKFHATTACLQSVYDPMQWMTTIAFRSMAPHSRVEVGRPFRGTYCLHHQGDTRRLVIFTLAAVRTWNRTHFNDVTYRLVHYTSIMLHVPAVSARPVFHTRYTVVRKLTTSSSGDRLSFYWQTSSL
jgi:hypothetical protein